MMNLLNSLALTYNEVNVLRALQEKVEADGLANAMAEANALADSLEELFS